MVQSRGDEVFLSRAQLPELALSTLPTVSAHGKTAQRYIHGAGLSQARTTGSVAVEPSFAQIDASVIRKTFRMATSGIPAGPDY